MLHALSSSLYLIFRFQHIVLFMTRPRASINTDLQRPEILLHCSPLPLDTNLIAFKHWPPSLKDVDATNRAYMFTHKSMYTKYQLASRLNLVLGQSCRKANSYPSSISELMMVCFQ